jgi:hypothetical protein
VGAKLVAVGNPLGLTRTVSEGILSAVRLDDGRQLVQMSAAISPGSSGGPVLNDRGEVVAIATSYLQDGQNLNFAVPVRYAMGLVDAGRRPVELAQAFGKPDPGEAPTSTAAPAQPSQHPPSALSVTGTRNLPARTLRPRPGITGTWYFTQMVDGPRGSFLIVGLLFLGNHDLGWLTMAPADSGEAARSVMTVQSHAATPDGRVSLTVGGTSLDGYQTDTGFFLENDHVGRGGTFKVMLTAVPKETALSAPTGLYAVTGQTARHVTGFREAGLTTWSGEAAVVSVRDTVWIDLFLTNDMGGTASATMAGPVRDSEFDLEREGTRLHGWVDHGAFQVEWVDRREWGRYEGSLTGRRK